MDISRTTQEHGAIFSLSHPVPNPMHCTCNIYLNTPLLSIQEIHQWPQDVICILCNCVSGISSNVSCPFHLTEDIRHLLDTLINTSLKAGQERGKNKMSALVHKVKHCKSIKHALNYTLFLRFAAHFLTVFVTKRYPIQFLVPIIHRWPSTSQTQSHFRRIFSFSLQKEMILSSFPETLILNSKHPAVSLLSTQGALPQGLGYCMEQWHNASTPPSTQESIGWNPSRYDPSQAKSLK